MADVDESRREWEAIYEKEQARRRNMDELKALVDKMGAEKKTAKTLLKLAVYTGGIKASEAADLIGVKRGVIDVWMKALMKREFVEVESTSHPNPTLRPSKDILKKFREFQKQKKKDGLGVDDIRDFEEKPAVEPQPAPQEERTEEENTEVTPEPGGTYLVYEPKSDKSLDLFVKEIRNNAGGLYITRSNPNQVKKRYYMGGAKVVWLTSVQTEKNIESVTGLQELSILVSKFIDNDEGKIILLEGLEYLVSNNNFPVVFRLIQQLRDKVSTSDAKMLIPLNPAALEDKQLSLLQGECQVIE